MNKSEYYSKITCCHTGKGGYYRYVFLELLSVEFFTNSNTND